jgi:hypothetical protein
MYDQKEHHTVKLPKVEILLPRFATVTHRLQHQQQRLPHRVSTQRQFFSGTSAYRSSVPSGSELQCRNTQGLCYSKLVMQQPKQQHWLGTSCLQIAYKHIDPESKKPGEPG